MTARRWATILRQLGHQVVVEQAFEGGRGDLLVALHARRSAPSIDRFRSAHPHAPIVLALTGTDVYHDIHVCDSARRSLEQADRYVVLQKLAVEKLPEHLRPRCRVIYQSAVAPRGTFAPARGVFDAAVLAHLRPVKDPLRAAAAARLLPADSTIRILHAGGTLDGADADEAHREAESNPRYRWLGDLPHWKALRMLARSRLLVLTSRDEGGANVVSEALACSVPIVSSDIPGSVGILGPDYPGYFAVEDTQALASILQRAERSDAFYAELDQACRRLRSLVDPAREQESWQALLRSL